MEILDQLETIKSEALVAFGAINGMGDLDAFHTIYLHKKSKLTELLKGLKNLSPEEKKQIAPKVQALKSELMEKYEVLKKELEKKELDEKLSKEFFDVTFRAPANRGAMHPISHLQKRTEDIFTALGFEIADGPEVETEWKNFDALNILPSHPARDMQDTFFVHSQDSDPKQNSVLRTHTSNVQIHKLLENQGPTRMICPGRCYRNEDVDATHDVAFYQFEGLLIDRDISMANLKSFAQNFLSSFFDREIKIRIRPAYFPFVEPGLEIDMWFEPPGKPGKWLEIMGAGMVHPNVLTNCGMDPDEYQGFAFGFGLTRLAMIYYEIDDIRYLFSNKVDFLKQF